MLTKMKLSQIFHINLDSKAPQILFKNGPKKKKSKKTLIFCTKKPGFTLDAARCQQIQTPNTGPAGLARDLEFLNLNIQICISISIQIFKPRIQSPKIRRPPDPLSAYPHPYVHYPDYPHYPAYPDSKILRNPPKSIIKIPSSVRQNKNILISRYFDILTF